ncbi:MAG: SIMPL domain-containing protein [Marmoricola sp.]
MSENSTTRSNLITAGVLVIALAAVFFVGKSLGDDKDGSGAAAAASSTETFGVVTGGEASVSGTPDQLTFTATVRNTQATNATALAKNNHDVRAITIAAKQKGVAAKDIQTQSISVRPKYDYRYRAGGRPRIAGYVATQSVRFKVRDLAKAGQTIGAVTNAAGNAVSIGGVTFSISNRDELVAQARTNAVKKSKAAAQALAKAAGRDVGDLEYVEEVAPQRVYGDFARAPQAYDGPMAAKLASSVAISPGKQQVSVTVKVRWSLAD